MSKIKLVETGWSLLPEGKYIFKVESVDYKEDFGKLEVKMITQSGKAHTERYTLTNKKGEANEGAIKAFSFFAKTALNNFDVEEIDPDDLVGCYVSAEATHVESTTINETTGEPYVNVNLKNMAAAVSFKDGASKKQKPVEEEVEDENVDLDDWLDD